MQKFFVLLTVIVFLFSFKAFAQQSVGIGTTNPKASAALDITSNNKGLLIPRTSTGGRTGIIAPAKGLMVYDTTYSAFFYYDGGKWRPMYEQNYDSATVDYYNVAADAVNLPTSALGSSVDVSGNSGFIYDNGGPSGNYSAGNNSYAQLYFDDSTIQIKIIVEAMNAETFYDSLFILQYNGNAYTDTIATFTGTQTGTVAAFNHVRVYFKANNVNHLPGFKIRWGRLRPSGALQTQMPLYGWHFNTLKMAAMGGLQQENNWYNDSVGLGALQYGVGTKAKGKYSFAVGNSSYATGLASVALGSGNKASEAVSVALGLGNTASGFASVALGDVNEASASFSTAIGQQNSASGYASIAIGKFSDASGYNSTAIGDNTTASGSSSTALGNTTIASGNSSTAMGYRSGASGDYSTAMGYNTTALGNYSTSMGRLSQASGNHSTAIGRNSLALGENTVTMGYNVSATGDYATAIGTNVAAGSDYSVAMGRSVSTASSPGSFIFGDNQTSLLTTTANNQMMMRFAGGYRLFTNAGASVGVSIAAGGNSWSSISDSTKKENYQPANTASFLSKISTMRLGSWNYKGQDKKTFRHYGPMAQEFYNNFCNDGIGTIGNDTTIASADIDGVMMIAIQALVKENEKLKTKNEELEGRLQKLEMLLNSSRHLKAVNK